jgi:hypothetical protein
MYVQNVVAIFVTSISSLGKPNIASFSYNTKTDHSFFIGAQDEVVGLHLGAMLCEKNLHLNMWELGKIQGLCPLRTCAH